MVEHVKPVGALSGRLAIVSGGARGIGAATCRALVAAGANVIAGDLLIEEGDALAADLGSACRFERLDVTSESDWKAIVAAGLEWGGAIDILVNCAGIVVFEPIDTLDLDAFERVIDVNLVGTFLGIKTVGGVMSGQRRGSIVTISSTAGLEGGGSMAAYCASKWGVRGLTKVAAIELGQFGIRVNSVHPGPVDTPMLNPAARAREQLSNLSIVKRMPLSRVADPSEIASVCTFLASDAASFMTGAELAVDGGVTAGMFHLGRPGAPSA